MIRDQESSPRDYGSGLAVAASITMAAQMREIQRLRCSLEAIRAVCILDRPRQSEALSKIHDMARETLASG